jgi:hypothetical protein
MMRLHHMQNATKKKGACNTIECCKLILAEIVGFEPTIPSGSTDFERRVRAKSLV